MEELSDIFDFGGMYFRNSQKAEIFNKTHKGLAFTDKKEFFNQGFEFIIVAISRSAVVTAFNLLDIRDINYMKTKCAQVCCMKKHPR